MCVAAFLALSLPSWWTRVAHQLEEVLFGHDAGPEAVRALEVRICVVDAVPGRRIVQEVRSPLLPVAREESGATVLGVEPNREVSVAVLVATVTVLPPAMVCTEPSEVVPVEAPVAVVTPVRPPGVKVAGVAVAVPPVGVEPVAVTVRRTGADPGTGMATTPSVAAVTWSGAVRAHPRMVGPGVEIESGDRPPEDAATAPTSAAAETTALRANRTRRTLCITFRPIETDSGTPHGDPAERWGISPFSQVRRVVRGVCDE